MNTTVRPKIVVSSLS